MEYSVTIDDGSYSNGDLAIDALTLESSKGLPVQFFTYIGCRYDNGGLFNASGSGIVGLGRGLNSLASQVGLSSAARFSYCLITFTYQGNATSKLSFGNTELEFGSGVVYTPLLYGGVSDNDYYVTLIAISVGKKRIELTNPSESGDSEEGNMIIDSGTTVIILPEELFPGFVSAVKDEIHLPIVDDPTFQQLSLYYNSSLDDFRPPSITVHFTGADVELSSKIKFISVDEQVVCLAFSPLVEAEPIALFGNLAQSNLATLTLESSKGLPVQFFTYIGCRYDNGGLFNVSGSGIVGLGRGQNSLASQVGLSSAARFSYCLITFTYQGNATSKLSFGNTELEFGSGVVYTPLLYGGVSDNDYYVTLIAISVGKKRIELTNPSESGDSEEGNMVIDSGTTVTILPEELFPGFVSAVKDEIHLPIVDDPTFQQLSLCYNSSLDDFRPPSITVHFTGADVELSSKIKFISVDEQVVCLAFSP
nr:aspartic proteinase cdr1 [Quercus suber]